MPAKPSWRARASARLALVAGVALRHIAFTGPSLGGAVLVSYGLSEIYNPLGWIAGGLFILAADRKLAAERRS